MPDQPREFEPLMIAIENVTDALDPQARENAIETLRALKSEFEICCCRKAHVIPYEQETSSTQTSTNKAK